MPNREDVEDVLQRVGLAAISYYPEIHAEDPEYSVTSDVSWCLEPLVDLTAEQSESLRASVGRTITNPTEHRGSLFREILALAPAEQ